MDLIDTLISIALDLTAAITVGEHVHIHNVDSKRGRGDRKAG